MCSSSQAQTNVKKWGEGNYVIMVVAEGGKRVGALCACAHHHRRKRM